MVPKDMAGFILPFSQFPILREAMEEAMEILTARLAVVPMVTGLIDVPFRDAKITGKVPVHAAAIVVAGAAGIKAVGVAIKKG